MQGLKGHMPRKVWMAAHYLELGNTRHTLVAWEALPRRQRHAKTKKSLGGTGPLEKKSKEA